MLCSAVQLCLVRRNGSVHGAEIQATDAEGRRHVVDSIGDVSKGGVHGRRRAEGGEVAVEGGGAGKRYL